MKNLLHHRAVQAVAAGLGGVLWGICFGADAREVLSWLGLVPLLLLLGVGERRWRLTLAFLHGLCVWFTAIPWIAYTVEVFGGQPTWLAVVCLVLLASLLAAYQVLFVLLGAGLWRRGGLIALFGLPSLWVVLEVLRAVALTGFPWNLAAYAWTDLPGALPTSAWVGAYGISFLVVTANSGVALGLAERRWAWPVLGILIPLTLLAAGGRWGGGRGDYVAPVPLPVRIVQPNIAILEDFSWDPVMAGQRRLMKLSEEACDTAGALVVWPESAGWPFSFTGDGPGDEGLRSSLESLRRRGCPVLFNSTHEPAPGRLYNSAFLLSRDGSVERYDKRHLVPFGEYVPLGRVFAFLEQIARAAGRFVPGEGVVLLPWGKDRLGIALCYEAIFPGEVAQTVRRGATVLASLSNDAWYGDSAALPQHLRAARFRAAENRRPMIRAAITGISALVGADGRVIGSLGVGEEGIIRGRVLGRRDVSPYTRAPWLVPLLCFLGAAFAIVRAVDRTGSGGRVEARPISVDSGKPSRPVDP